jgi:hypothetical protein
VNPLAGTASIDKLSTGNTLPIVSRPWGFNHWAPVSDDVFFFLLFFYFVDMFAIIYRYRHWDVRRGGFIQIKRSLREYDVRISRHLGSEIGRGSLFRRRSDLIITDLKQQS